MRIRGAIIAREPSPGDYQTLVYFDGGLYPTLMGSHLSEMFGVEASIPLGEDAEVVGYILSDEKEDN